MDVIKKQRFLTNSGTHRQKYKRSDYQSLMSCHFLVKNKPWLDTFAKLLIRLFVIVRHSHCRQTTRTAIFAVG